MPDEVPHGPKLQRRLIIYPLVSNQICPCVCRGIWLTQVSPKQELFALRQSGDLLALTCVTKKQKTQHCNANDLRSVVCILSISFPFHFFRLKFRTFWGGSK